MPLLRVKRHMAESTDFSLHATISRRDRLCKPMAGCSHEYAGLHSSQRTLSGRQPPFNSSRESVSAQPFEGASSPVFAWKFA